MGERWRRSGGYAGGSTSISTCGMCYSLQGEADGYEWRLGECDGEDLEVLLETVKVSTCGVCYPLQGEADGYEWRLGERLMEKIWRLCWRQ